MGKVRTTLTIDEGVLREVRVRAARSGRRDSEVIEEAVRKGLDMDVFGRLWEKNNLPEEEAMDLALEAKRAARRK